MEKTFENYKEASTLFFGELGSWVYDTWDSHNEKYFNSELLPGVIVFGLTPHGHALGRYHGSMNMITLHKSLVEPKSDAPWLIANLSKIYASDVLLHEMIHQAIYHKHGHDGHGISSHNNIYWVSEILRISQLLGLSGVKVEVVKQKRVKEAGATGEGKVTWFVPDGHLTRKQMSTWPHTIRPDGFYDIS